MHSTGFNVIGYISCNFGLGIAARNTIKQLLSCGYPVTVYDIPLAGRSGADRTYEYLYCDLKALPFHSINIFHCNAPQIPQIIPLLHDNFMANRLNTCVPFWELPRIPDNWVPILEQFDAILAPSTFIRHAIASCSSCCVLSYPQVTTVNESTPSNRHAFDLPEDAFLFVTSFDIGSDLLRKNPDGAIDAFCSAFPTGNNTGLVVKVNRTVTTSFYNGLLDKLNQYSKKNSAIRIIDTTLSYSDIITLYASCDCYVSLHRSEGLGLGIMESMALGKPVIATHWSGPTDFMNPENSCMVSFRLTHCDPLFNPAIDPQQLGFQGVWAEPHQQDAVGWMQTLVHDKSLCRNIGKNAQLTMQYIKKQALEGTVFNMLHSMLETYRSGIPTTRNGVYGK